MTMLLCVTTFIAGLVLILVEFKGKWAVSFKTTFLLKALARKKVFCKKNLRLQPITFSQSTDGYLGPCQISVIV